MKASEALSPEMLLEEFALLFQREVCGLTGFTVQVNWYPVNSYLYYWITEADPTLVKNFMAELFPGYEVSIYKLHRYPYYFGAATIEGSFVWRVASYQDLFPLYKNYLAAEDFVFYLHPKENPDKVMLLFNIQLMFSLDGSIYYPYLQFKSWVTHGSLSSRAMNFCAPYRALSAPDRNQLYAAFPRELHYVIDNILSNPAYSYLDAYRNDSLICWYDPSTIFEYRGYVFNWNFRLISMLKT